MFSTVIRGGKEFAAEQKKKRSSSRKTMLKKYF